jgi:hypothetical protein
MKFSKEPKKEVAEPTNYPIRNFISDLTDAGDHLSILINELRKERIVYRRKSNFYNWNNKRFIENIEVTLEKAFESEPTGCYYRPKSLLKNYTSYDFDLYFKIILSEIFFLNRFENNDVINDTIFSYCERFKKDLFSIHCYFINDEIFYKYKKLHDIYFSSNDGSIVADVNTEMMSITRSFYPLSSKLTERINKITKHHDSIIWSSTLPLVELYFHESFAETEPLEFFVNFLYDIPLESNQKFWNAVDDRLQVNYKGEMTGKKFLYELKKLFNIRS